MREIKFRAWDGSKIYYAGNPINLGFCEFANFYISMGGDVSLLEDDDGGKSGVWEHDASDGKKFILMQYTGLKDKNGVEIYEGDIIIFDADEFAGFNEITWFHSGFAVNSESTRVMLADVLTYIVDGNCWGVEVVGNIYENKELLLK